MRISIRFIERGIDMAKSRKGYRFAAAGIAALMVALVTPAVGADEADVKEDTAIKTTVYSYDVSFYDGGSLLTSLPVIGGSTVAEPLTPLKNGYEFDGWYKDEGLTEKWDFVSDTVAADTVLYAKWSGDAEVLEDTYNIAADSKSFTVNFYTDTDSSSPMTSSPVKKNGKVTKPEFDPTKDGYAFGGWFKDADYSKRWDFDKDKVTADTDLYALWLSFVPAQDPTEDADGNIPYWVGSDGKFYSDEYSERELDRSEIIRPRLQTETADESGADDTYAPAGEPAEGGDAQPAYGEAAPQETADDKMFRGHYNSKGDLTIRWKEIEGADSYSLYLVSYDRAVTLIEGTTDTSYTLENATGGPYKFMLKYTSGRGEVSKATDSYYGTACPKYLKPVPQVSVGDDIIDLSWEPIPGAEYYRVVLIGNDNKMRKACEPVVNYAQVKAVPGRDRGVAVKAYVNGVWTTVTEEEVIPVELSSRDGERAFYSYYNEQNDLTLYWDPVGGAESYSVYLIKNDKAIKLADTTEPKYTMPNAGEGPYRFLVKYTINGEISRATESYYRTICPDTYKPVPEISVNNGLIDLKWNSIPRADLYRIYCTDNEGKLIRLVGETKKNSITFQFWPGTYNFVVKAHVDGVWTMTKEDDYVTATV